MYHSFDTFFATNYGFCSFLSIAFSPCGELQYQSKWPKVAANNIQTVCTPRPPAIYIYFKKAGKNPFRVAVFKAHSGRRGGIKAKTCNNNSQTTKTCPFSGGESAVIIKKITGLEKCQRWELFGKHTYSSCYLHFLLQTVGIQREEWTLSKRLCNHTAYI